MVDILDGARGLTARSLVEGACVGIPEIVPIPNLEIKEKLVFNRTCENLKNQKNVTPKRVVSRTELIFCPAKRTHFKDKGEQG